MSSIPTAIPTARIGLSVAIVHNTRGIKNGFVGTETIPVCQPDIIHLEKILNVRDDSNPTTVFKTKGSKMYKPECVTYRTASDKIW